MNHMEVKVESQNNNHMLQRPREFVRGRIPCAHSIRHTGLSIGGCFIKPKASVRLRREMPDWNSSFKRGLVRQSVAILIVKM